MSSPASLLLATKHRVPASRPGTVPRGGLVDRLDRRCGERVVLVSAPAGFGKTTLLAWWAARRDAPVAWVSLDEADTDPVRFLRYVNAAVETASPGSASATADLLGMPIGTDTEQLLTAFVNELSDGDVDLSIVLDDYHLLESTEVHWAVTFLVEHLPTRVGLVIATRADPPLPLPSWRAGGLLGEIRAADLRFTLAEAECFLRDTMGVDLSDQDVAVLMDRTEGWPAGVHLAALSLRRSGDPHDFVGRFTGGDRFILDYLMGEVLAALPASHQEFLLRTSILDRLCGSLCDAVTGESGGSTSLEELNRSNALVEALDTDGRWYRSHRLFADLLRHRLGTKHPGLEPEYHRRASGWYESEGMLADAIHHALAGDDRDRAARLIELVAVASLAAGEFATVIGWIESLGAGQVAGRPFLGAVGAMARFYNGRPMESALDWLSVAEAEGAPPAARGAAFTVRAVMAAYTGEGRRAREHAESALRLLPHDQTFLRGFVGTAVGLSALTEGDVDGAERAFEDTLHTARVAGLTPLQELAIRRLAVIAAIRGDLHQAEARYRSLLEITTGDSPKRRSPFAALALVGLAGIARERGDLEVAEGLIREGIELLQVLGTPFAIEGTISLGRVLSSRGRLREAAAAMEQAGRLAARFDATTNDDVYVAAMAVRVHLAEGDLGSAARWAEGCEKRASGARVPLPFYPGEAEAGSLARVLLARGRPEEAVAALSARLDQAEAQGRYGSVIDLEIVHSLALDRCGDERGAFTQLSKALQLAAPHGHLQSFLDEGEPMRNLLRRAVESGVAPPYGRAVLAAAGPARGGGMAGLRESLTGAERRVLARLPSDLTSAEIARELYVAPSTVRSHVKAIYRKLGVRKRRDAVDRARRLGLL